MGSEQAFLRLSLVTDSRSPLSSRISTTLRRSSRCCCCGSVGECEICTLQVALVNWRGREIDRLEEREEEEEEEGLKGKRKSLVEWENRRVLEAEIVAIPLRQ